MARVGLKKATEEETVVGFASVIPARDDEFEGQIEGQMVSELAAIYLNETVSGRGGGLVLAFFIIAARNLARVSALR